MCARANSASVPDSFHAVVGSILAVAGAVVALVVALATAPWRAAVLRPTKLGKADIFEQWVTTSGQVGPEAGTLVVVSIGTTLDGRDLSADEIGGALAAQ